MVPPYVLHRLRQRFKVLSTGVNFDLGTTVNTLAIANNFDDIEFIPGRNSFNKQISFTSTTPTGEVETNKVTCIVSANGNCSIKSAKSLQQANDAAQMIVHFLNNQNVDPIEANIIGIKEIQAYGNVEAGPTRLNELVQSEFGREKKFVLVGQVAKARILENVDVTINSMGRITLMGPSIERLRYSLAVIAQLPGIDPPTLPNIQQ